MQAVRFIIVSPGYNVADYVERCLMSIRKQRYTDYKVCLIDDASTDRSSIKVMAHYSSLWGWKFIKNTTNQGSIYNRLQGAAALNPRPEDVVVFLDADDRFFNGRVLQRLYDIYQDPNVWLTYGSYTSDPRDDGCPPAVAYNPECIEKRDYRNLLKWGRPFNHLKTVRYGLMQQIDHSYLQTEEGEYFKTGEDVAFMPTFLEMANGKFRFVKEKLLVYSSNNPLSDWRINADSLDSVYERIMSLPRHPIVKELSCVSSS